MRFFAPECVFCFTSNLSLIRRPIRNGSALLGPGQNGRNIEGPKLYSNTRRDKGFPNTEGLCFSRGARPNLLKSALIGIQAEIFEVGIPQLS